MSRVVLRVNRRDYEGWKAIRVTRSVEALAGSFSLSVSDRWAGQATRWPIGEEDECQVLLDGEPVIDGYVDRRRPSFSANSRELTFEGRDRAAALVDCSALPERWQFRRSTVVDIARRMAEPFGITVRAQPGLELLAAPEKLVVSPGDSAFAPIERAARAAGVLVVSDGLGGILITRAGSERASDPLIEGQNLKGGSADFDASGRFRRYVVATQIAGRDEASGSATRVQAEATDEGVRRTDRVLLIRPESGATAAYARQRADWEARIRAAVADAVSVDVVGWRQSGGAMWPLLALVYVRSATLGIDGDMRISQVTHGIGAEGQISEIRLVRPDAFTPEPRAVVKAPSGGRGRGAWKELAGGAN